MDRLATRVDPLTRSESYQYDLAGNITQFTDRKSHATGYTYDALNRRTGVTYADASTTSYTYDAGNRLTQVVDSIAGNITRTYDGLNRLTSETTPQGSVSYTTTPQRKLTCAQKKEGSTGRVIYCTTIASPLLIAISRILAGRSNGASMSNPLG